MDDTQSYKERHEQFVSGLAGGTIAEINALATVPVATYLASCAVIQRFGAQSGPLAHAIDFTMNWIGILASVTVSANIPLQLSGAYLALAAVAIIDGRAQKRPSSSERRQNAASDTSANPVAAYLPRKNYLTAYRGTMMILTCLAILAVDFRVFPRRLAKVETWGTSMMDLGVGSFVFSMGLVSARAVLADAYAGRQTPPATALGRSLRQSAMVLGLGLIRLAAVKLLDYQEHVTEYGVHWNFFMTLGLLPPFVTVLSLAPRRVPTALVALVVAGAYELALDRFGLATWILSAPRDNVIAANKEGLCSFAGYLSIFLSGQATGYYVLPARVGKSALFPHTLPEVVRNGGHKHSRWRPVRLLATAFATYSLLLWLALYPPWDASTGLTPSRRLANLPYVLWTCAFNTGALTAYAVLDAASLAPTPPPSFDAVNANGLAVFLFANIATGVVNMSVQTIDASRLHSMLVLSLYAFSVFAFAGLLRHFGIRIKI